jgi:purine-nucleoside phosphorylase
MHADDARRDMPMRMQNAVYACAIPDDGCESIGAMRSESMNTMISCLKENFPGRFDAAVVLGSGLGGFADRLPVRHRLATADIPGYPASTVAGHSGAIIDAACEGRRLLIFDGRIHGYEGYAPLETSLPAIIAHALGAGMFIVTNAAGGLHPGFNAGDLMLITDYFVLPLAPRMGLALTRLTGYNDREGLADRGERPSTLLDPRIRSLTLAAAAEANVALREGTYGYCSGPSYETRAEIHFLRRAGSDAVGMSTVPELITARMLGLGAVAISCITNKARTVPTTVSHEEVTSVAAQASDRLSRLLTALIRSLPETDA